MQHSFLIINICNIFVFRLVSWHVNVLKKDGMKGINAQHNPYTWYYSHDNIDEGYLMETPIPITEVRDFSQLYMVILTSSH